MLIELLALSDPPSFVRACTMRERIQAMVTCLGQGDTWEIETAAMLAPVGIGTIPPIVILKSRAGHTLSDDERDMLKRVPAIGHKLLANIPRLEGVAKVVLYQNKQFDGSGFPLDAVSGTAIPFGARLIRVLTDIALAEAAGIVTAVAIAQLGQLPGFYDPIILDAAAGCLPGLRNAKAAVLRQRTVTVRELRIGHVLRSDIRTTDGKLLLAAGQVISVTVLERLANSARVNDIVDSISVEEVTGQGSERHSKLPQGNGP